MKHCLAALSLSALAACSSSPEAPPPLVVDEAGVLVLPNGAVIDGLVRAREIHQLPDSVATVTADAMLYGDELVLLEGTIRVASGVDEAGRADAPNLQLLSDGAIVTLGTILGGRGADRERSDNLPRAGGKGTSILFDAPDRLLYGELRAGAGGSGWAGGPGAPGGSLVAIGGRGGGFEVGPYLERIRAASSRSVGYGGDGGSPGNGGVALPRVSAASGGDGGSALMAGSEMRFDELRPEIRSLFGR